MKKTTAEYVSDLSAAPAQHRVTVRIDNETYSLDVTTAERDQFRAAAKPYLDVARQTVTSDAQAIREWARAKGIEVGARGRIASEVVAEFGKAKARKPAKV